MAGKEQDEREDILERALAAYSTQEPLSGLEERILARVLAAKPTRRFGWPRWVFAGAAAAGILFVAVAIGVYRDSARHSQATRPVAQSHAAAPVVEQALPPVNSAASAQLGRRKRLPHVFDGAAVHPRVGRHAPVALPKLQQFPSPAPLTQGERALLALVYQAPDEARKVALEQAREDVSPIQIEAIQIEPLQIGGLTEEQ